MLPLMQTTLPSSVGMTLTNWLTVVGWSVVFILGILAAVITERFKRKQKIIVWGVVNETAFVAAQISKQLGVPVKLLVGTTAQDCLTTLTLRFENVGNEVLEALSAKIVFNPTCTLLKEPDRSEFGEFGQHISFRREEAATRVTFDFLNPQQKLKLDFVLSGYEPGACSVDMAAPGVRLIRRDGKSLQLPSLLDAFRGVGLNVLGVHYDPSVAALEEIAFELRAIRRRQL